MQNVIIYQVSPRDIPETGPRGEPLKRPSLGIIVPNPSWDIDQVARKDVPAGAPYLIIDAADVPEDRTYREAWEANFSKPDGHGIGADDWFAEQAAAAEEQAARMAEVEAGLSAALAAPMPQPEEPAP